MYVNAKEELKHSSVFLSLWFTYLCRDCCYVTLCWVSFFTSVTSTWKLDGHSSLNHSGPHSVGADTHHHCLDLIFTARGVLKWGLKESCSFCFSGFGSIHPSLATLWFTLAFVLPNGALLCFEIFGARGILKFEFIFIKYLYAENKHMNFHTAWVPDKSA